MKWVAVLPYVYKPYFDECVTTMHPEFKKNVIFVDNTVYNKGLMWAQNIGVQKVINEKLDWLIIISAAIRFGQPDGGMDFVKILEDHMDFQVIHAASPNVVGGLQHKPEGADQVNKIKGWHLTAFSRECLEEVGGFDLNFTPYSLDDICLSIRIQKAFKGRMKWNTFPCNVDDTGLMAHGINLGGVRAPYEPKAAYFAAKYGREGGEWDKPTYDHPFNDETKPLSWWPTPPDPRCNMEAWEFLDSVLKRENAETGTNYETYL